MTPPFPTLDDIRSAGRRIAEHAHRTPVLTCRSLDAIAGAELFFKCENFQKVGAFKFRGACNAVFSLPEAEAAHGVATHSSGNHAQAVALAAKLRGIDAHIVMPSDAPTIKRAAVRGYGARVIECAPTLEAREKMLEQVVAETGAAFVHPYDDPRVVAGQATVGVELLEQTSRGIPSDDRSVDSSEHRQRESRLRRGSELDTILAPVGGGGLLSGVALAVAYLAPHVHVIACEPELADDAARGFRDGERKAPRPPRTIADGLRTALGPLSFAVMRAHVRDVVLVDEEEIVAAMRTVWERMNIIIEPSAAVPVAVALRGTLRNQRVGIVLTGGNVDLDRLPWQ